jgi:hypothetical protein
VKLKWGSDQGTDEVDLTPYGIGGPQGSWRFETTPGTESGSPPLMGVRVWHNGVELPGFLLTSAMLPGQDATNNNGITVFLMAETLDGVTFVNALMRGVEVSWLEGSV